MRYRAIATDLDGTLLRTDGSVSKRTRTAVHAAEDAGLLVVIATGRPPRRIPPVIDELGDRGLVVCANGASIYDAARHELVHRTEIAPDVARSLVNDLKGIRPDMVIGVEQGFDFAVDDNLEASGLELVESWNEPGLRHGPVCSFLDRPVTKLIVRVANPVPDDWARTVQVLVKGRALVTHSTDQGFLELSHPSAHKASAVERLLAEVGITPSEVAAFGDMPNDVELIRWAGLGVAVANAHPMLLAVSDEITASNDDDGVAAVIERIVMNAARW